MDCLVAAAILGFFGGLFGAFFIRINNFINNIRKKYLITKTHKIVEGLALIFVTVSVMYLAVLIKYYSYPDADKNTDVC